LSGFVGNSPSVSESPILDRKDKVKHYIRIKVHNNIALRFPEHHCASYSRCNSQRNSMVLHGFVYQLLCIISSIVFLWLQGQKKNPTEKCF